MIIYLKCYVKCFHIKGSGVKWPFKLMDLIQIYLKKVIGVNVNDASFQSILYEFS